MGVFAENLDLHILKIEWGIAILKLKKELNLFWDIFLADENWYNLGNFQGKSQKRFSTWSLMNPFNYKLVNNGSTSPKRGPN